MANTHQKDTYALPFPDPTLRTKLEKLPMVLRRMADQPNIIHLYLYDNSISTMAARTYQFPLLWLQQAAAGREPTNAECDVRHVIFFGVSGRSYFNGSEAAYRRSPMVGLELRPVVQQAHMFVDGPRSPYAEFFFTPQEPIVDLARVALADM